MTAFTDSKFHTAIMSLKKNKTASIDMLVEQIKHFGFTTRKWVLNLFNDYQLSKLS